MYTYFYNKNLRKIVVGFGALFNSIKIEHVDPDGGDPIEIRVPISYAPQEKFIQRLLKPSSIDDSTKIENQLPLMSYIINSITPDPVRRRNKFSETKTGLGPSCGFTGGAIYQEVPVNISFSLFIYTRHIDDTLQIVEQIIPYFNPEHIIKIDMNEVHKSVNIPIVMTNNNISERYEGDFSSRRINISSLNFVAKSYIFGQILGITGISQSSVGSDIIFG
jgi:hypothetical protein